MTEKLNRFTKRTGKRAIGLLMVCVSCALVLGGRSISQEVTQDQSQTKEQQGQIQFWAEQVGAEFSETSKENWQQTAMENPVVLLRASANKLDSLNQESSREE